MSKCTHAATLHETNVRIKTATGRLIHIEPPILLVVIEWQGHFIPIAKDIMINMLADGHTVSNAPDLSRPPKLSGTGPG